MNLFPRLAYRAGIPWTSSPKSSLDHIFNRKAAVTGIQVKLREEVLDGKTVQILAGCPAGGRVEVSQAHGGALHFHVEHARYIQNRHGCNVVKIRRATDGFVLYLDYIWFAKDCPRGLGVIMLLRMAQLARELGFRRIELLAAGGSGIKGMAWQEDYWGFQYWPRLGFDTELQQSIRDLLSAHATLSQATHVSEVVATDLPWWKEHGDGWEMKFDLSENSASWYTLNAYLATRKGLLT